MIKSSRIGRKGDIPRIQVMRNAQRNLSGEHEGQIPLRKLAGTWANNIKTDLKEIGWKGVDCINSTYEMNRCRSLCTK
jgi:hypothetical protein